MNRKDFIKTCGYSCLAFAGFSILAESCKPVQSVQAVKEEQKLKIALSEFTDEKGKKRGYIIVRNSALNFPIVLYRFSDTEFSALLLQCTHNGSELNVNGDLLSCPSHGAEFDTKGGVVQGPAERKLKSYNVTTDIDFIYIHLT